MATRCKECKTLYFPPRVDCLNCRESNVEWIPIDGRGKLVTFTEVHLAPPAFQQETPYLLGLAELEEGPRVFAPIDSRITRDYLKPGALLVLHPSTNENGAFYQLEKREQNYLRKQ